MSDELDRRSALAMGWMEHKELYGTWFEKKNGDGVSINGDGVYNWSPSTDRNDLAELLKEVEQRGLEFDLDRIFDFPSIAATFGLDVAKLCEAACEVLEAANGN